VDHGLVGGQSRQRQPRRLAPVEVRGFACELARLGGDALGVGAVALDGPADEADDLVPGLEPGRAGTGLLHDPGHVPAGDDGEEGVHQRVHGAGLEAQISGVERGGLYADPDLVGEHLRLRYLDDFEDLRTAEAVVDGRLHDHDFLRGDRSGGFFPATLAGPPSVSHLTRDHAARQ
jgi:hypothetical protein